MVKAFSKIFLFLFLSLFLYGNIYIWTDENGIKHFSNISPPVNKPAEEIGETNIVFKKLSTKKNQNQLFDVLTVFDGDTIKVKGLDLIFKVRLVGIDSPEMGYDGYKAQSFSQKSKQRLRDLLDKKKVRIKSYGTDTYNRQLAEVFADEKNINMEMIKSGLAEVYTGNRPKKLDSQTYLQEESKARSEGKGMWIQGSNYKSPRQWRKEHPRK